MHRSIVSTPHVVIGKRSDAVIVGAGVSGLAAGAKLVTAGLRVTILEARDRIGGRILTAVDQALPVAIELGAEFLHGKIDTGRLAVEDVPSGDGKLGRVLARFVRDVERHPDAPSVGERIDRFHGTDDERALVRAYVEGFHAANPGRFSPRAFLEEERGSRNVLARIPAGYVGVARHLDRGLVRHSVRVRAIHHGPRGVALETNVGAIEARAAIVTVPLPILQTMVFDPPPKRHTEAARARAMGHVARVVLQFDRRRWPADLGFLHALDQPFPTFWTSRPRDTGLIVAWAGGPRADRLLAEDRGRRIEIAVASLERALGSQTSLSAHLVDAHHHDWLADPWSQGAYSWVPTGAEDAKRVLAEPVDDTLFFAGEAVHLGAGTGTVHGAIESGERAARTLLARFDPSRSLPATFVA
ncbi:MAG: flavin monoamine oxidase family protein [Polyangiales bacterium]